MVAMQILIPVMGRSGASIQPDIFIGVVMWVTTIMTYNLIVIFISLFVMSKVQCNGDLQKMTSRTIINLSVQNFKIAKCVNSCFKLQ